ncbi:hypothetical protein E3P92_02600 [Wallemia ichthyophaga]|uniref:Peptidase M48 domain-containing protein n=1 Tax=Wallemia ichthyophaga TaxID=245174 RepID=A0A4T0HCE2_WALIC|nr:hypothetical protein E3P94_02445 [Wallemia ichthyophaga]TIB11262.1 hypothetical protein E3P90_02495 [Wallemia ichthyophaga]TIB12006.1 hypothetical protein E3P93_02392 [Wallemia ichthyophaga]TIB12293.1 hypothetical protein E3P92_02600 [Wallemia ichthyophaga]TIB23437.1 hypothetical protein E3P88_02514 [Wallemia ichthyophaga]
MSEQDELEWSNMRLKSLLNKDENFAILDNSDPRTKSILRITRRLVNTLPSSNKVSILPTWPDPITHGISSLVDRRDLKKPSTTTSHMDIVNFPDGLTLHHPDLKANWNIYLIDDDTQFNAYAMPSKDIVIYTGLMDLLDYREDFLSTVLAHEIAHVTQRHAIENVSTLILTLPSLRCNLTLNPNRLQLQNLAAVVFDFVRGAIVSFTIPFPIVTSSLTLAINWINDPLSDSAFSRKLELEADVVGLNIMARFVCLSFYFFLSNNPLRAGFNPTCALQLWSIMSAFDKDNNENKSIFEQAFPFLNTHPPSEYRLSVGA